MKREVIGGNWDKVKLSEGSEVEIDLVATGSALKLCRVIIHSLDPTLTDRGEEQERLRFAIFSFLILDTMDTTPLVQASKSSTGAAQDINITSPLELTQFVNITLTREQPAIWLALQVETILNDLESKFDTMSSDVLTRR